MRLGIALPHFGPYATPQAIVAVACKAEALGFASLWVLDRLLWPIQPVSKYPGNPRGEMPSRKGYPGYLYSDLASIFERAGRIRIFKNGTLLGTPFLDISAEVKSGGEQGLLGLAGARLAQLALKHLPALLDSHEPSLADKNSLPPSNARFDEGSST